MTDAVGELAEIRRELRVLRIYVEDTSLRSEIGAWIQESHAKSDAETAREYVEQELNRMLMDNEMYHAPTVGRPEEAFPDRCSDCRHYGSACPVLRDEVQVTWRERKLERAETEKEARQVYQEQAIDASCIVIPELLETWDNQYAVFVAEGQRLLEDAEEAVHRDGESGDAPDVTGDLQDVLPAADADLAADGGGEP